MDHQIKRIEITLETRKYSKNYTTQIIGNNQFQNTYTYQSFPEHFYINFDDNLFTGKFETDDFICEQFFIVEIDKKKLKNNESKLSNWIKKNHKANLINNIGLILFCIILFCGPIVWKMVQLKTSFFGAIVNIFKELDSFWEAGLIIVMIFSFLGAIANLSIVTTNYFWRRKQEKFYFKVTTDGRKREEFLELIKNKDHKTLYGFSTIKQKDNERLPLKSSPMWISYKSTNGEGVGPPYSICYFEDKRNLLNRSYTI